MIRSFYGVIQHRDGNVMHFNSLETMQGEIELIQSHVFLVESSAKCPFRRPVGPPGSEALRSTAQVWLPTSGVLERQRNMEKRCQ